MDHKDMYGGSERDSNDQEKKKKSGNKKTFMFLPKFGCLKIEEDKDGNFDIEVDNIGGDKPNPTHLVILVNGIIGSAQDWKFAAKQFLRKYPRDAVVHCSQANYSLLTFDGVDVMGERLAAEVISVIKRHPSVQKISFVGHSLGGLTSRYAIAKLYGRDITRELAQANGENKSNGSTEASDEKVLNKIAGLEPMNFITFATPHLGSRGHKQVPMFCGSYTLEKAAVPFFSWCLGRTGKHLFLTDGRNGTAPLLLQMVSDTENLKFMSALQSFKHRVAYANARFDSLVGWSTSSLRRRNELPKRRHLSRHDAYRHIVKMAKLKDDNPEIEIPLELKANECKAVDKESNGPQQEVPSEFKVDEFKAIDIEEEMLRCLTKLSWERVDVKFNGFWQRFLAHNTIQVNSTCIYSAGKDVVQHMINESFLL